MVAYLALSQKKAGWVSRVPWRPRIERLLRHSQHSIIMVRRRRLKLKLKFKIMAVLYSYPRP
jgi:hypothetical protein